MSETVYRFLEPLDVLFFRGNKAFGDPGSFGESMALPWPSVAAGALRSRMLVDAKIDLNRFAGGMVEHPELGVPEQPGSFRVIALNVARRLSDGGLEILVAPPADLVVTERNDEPFARLLRPLLPRDKDSKLKSSYCLDGLPALAEKVRSKPKGNYWLTQSGWKKYLDGQVPSEPKDFVKSDVLWKFDMRVGVGLDKATRSVQEGRLFSNRALALCEGVGFLAALTGIAEESAPSSGTVRLGGDGRAAVLQKVNSYRLPEPDYDVIVRTGHCRMVLATPGIFENGWLPTGVAKINGEYRFDAPGVRGKLVAAAAPRAEIISGWDLAKEQPKAAQRVAPAGSVYWLAELETTPADLRRLVEDGLWKDPYKDPQRRAEGFNRLWLAQWA